MKIKIIEHGVMLSDYFSGTTGVMLPIHITPKTTIKEVINEICEEISYIYDHIQYTLDYDNKIKDSVLHNAIDECLDTLKSHNIDDNDVIYCKDFEYSDNEYEENPVAIFTLELDEE